MKDNNNYNVNGVDNISDYCNGGNKDDTNNSSNNNNSLKRQNMAFVTTPATMATMAAKIKTTITLTATATATTAVTELS